VEYSLKVRKFVFTTKTEVENGVLKIYIEKDKSISTIKSTTYNYSFEPKRLRFQDLMWWQVQLLKLLIF
jgi:hypothetical protein